MDSQLDTFNRQPIIGNLEQDTTIINRLNKIIGEANHAENTTTENTQSFWRKWFGSSTAHQAEKLSRECQRAASAKDEESEEQKKKDC